jgi:hypothetical protein
MDERDDDDLSAWLVLNLRFFAFYITLKVDIEGEIQLKVNW